jgi:hypothetical protein
MPAHFSEPLKDLVGLLLNKDAEKRLTAEQILTHKFFVTE